MAWHGTAAGTIKAIEIEGDHQEKGKKQKKRNDGNKAQSQNFQSVASALHCQTDSYKSVSININPGIDHCLCPCSMSMSMFYPPMFISSHISEKYFCSSDSPFFYLSSCNCLFPSSSAFCIQVI